MPALPLSGLSFSVLVIFSASLPSCPLCPKHLPPLSPGLALLFSLRFFWIPPLFLVLIIPFFVLTFLPVLTQSSSCSSLPLTLQSPRPFLPVPYLCVLSFSADSEVEKEQWLEAMQGAIAEALSTSEVAERIWAAAPNRFCADCGASQPDWASINLCVVICKRCAGRYVCNRLAIGSQVAYSADPGALIPNAAPALLAILLGVTFSIQFIVILFPQGWGQTKQEKAFFFRATWQVSELRSEPRLLESGVPVTLEACRRPGLPGFSMLREEPGF